jgi:hypothetical protein
MRLLIAAIATGSLAIVFGSVNAQAQTGPAVAAGACSIANSGDAENLTINCGIGKEQGQKIIDMLNHALASKDVATVNAKLDELLQIAKQQSRLQPNHLYSDGIDYGSAESQNGPDMKAKTILLSGFSALPGYEGKTLLYNYNDANILKIVCPPTSTAPLSGVEGHFGMITLHASGLTCRVVP